MDQSFRFHLSTIRISKSFIICSLGQKFNSIQKQVKKSSLAKIASASNIFGRGFAEKRIQLILTDHPNILTQTQTIQTQEKEELITKIKSVEGLGEKTALQFVEALPLFQKFLEESNILKIKATDTKSKEKEESKSKSKDKPDKPDKPETLKDEIIVLSDFKGVNKTKKEFTTELEELGGTIEPTLTKKTTMLIVGSKDVETGKIKKAKSQANTKILTFEEFNNQYL